MRKKQELGQIYSGSGGQIMAAATGKMLLIIRPALLRLLPPQHPYFVPSVGEWQTKTLSLSSLAGLPYVRLAIEDDCNNGNKIYFDNVLVFDSSTNVNVNEISNANQLLLFPNPAGHEINVLNNSTLPIQLSLYNCLGERILEKVLFDKLNTINISDYSEGSYFYTLSSETKVIKKGVVFKQ